MAVRQLIHQGSVRVQNVQLIQKTDRTKTNRPSERSISIHQVSYLYIMRDRNRNLYILNQQMKQRKPELLHKVRRFPSAV